MVKKIYSENDFIKLVKKNSYQVFFFVSKVSMPFPFAAHPWIVTNSRGKMKKFQVLSWVKKKEGNRIKISEKNFSSPMPIFTGKPERRYKYSGLIKIYEGAQAKKIIAFLWGVEKKYPWKDEYRYLPGPNSNTFVEWVIESLGLKLKLPANAYGKKYVKKYVLQKLKDEKHIKR